MLPSVLSVVKETREGILNVYSVMVAEIPDGVMFFYYAAGNKGAASLWSGGRDMAVSTCGTVAAFWPT